MVEVEKLTSESGYDRGYFINKIEDLINGRDEMVSASKVLTQGESTKETAKKLKIDRLTQEFFHYINFDKSINDKGIVGLKDQFDKLAEKVYNDKDINSAITVLDITRNIILGKSKNVENEIYDRLSKDKRFSEKGITDQKNILYSIFKSCTTRGEDWFRKAFNSGNTSEDLGKSIREISHNDTYMDLNLFGLYKSFHSAQQENGLTEISNDIYVELAKNLLKNNLDYFGGATDKESELYRLLNAYHVNNDFAYQTRENEINVIRLIMNKIMETQDIDAGFFTMKCLFSRRESEQNAETALQNFYGNSLWENFDFKQKLSCISSYLCNLTWKDNKLDKEHGDFTSKELVNEIISDITKCYKESGDEKLAIKMGLEMFFACNKKTGDDAVDKYKNDRNNTYGKSVSNQGIRFEKHKTNSAGTIFDLMHNCNSGNGGEAADIFNNKMTSAEQEAVINATRNATRNALRNSTNAFSIFTTSVVEGDSRAGNNASIVGGASVSSKLQAICGLHEVGRKIDGESINEAEKFLLTGTCYDPNLGEELNQAFSTNYSFDFSDFLNDFSIESHIARYAESQRLAEVRESYGDTPIVLDSEANNDSKNPSGQAIASGLLEGNNSATLDSYKIAKSNIDSTEKATLRYSAFGVVFNNLFNQDDPVIQKLVSLKIDLRSEFSNYGIYNYEDEHAVINQAALKKFVEEVLQNGKLEVKEIDDLVGRINSIPENVNKNYEILCGNFHTDQKTFEKVAKIYALGEVIENIKKTFNESFEKKPNNLGEYTGLELDKEKPAEIVGDCLFLKGKLNGTDITIKYDLGSGKIFMNSFIQPSPYGDKISVGNTQPHTQIGRIDSFDRILEGYDSTSIIQPSEDSKEAGDTGNHSNESVENPVSAQITQEKLTENKLLQNLQEIGKIASEKAESQAQKNSAVTNLLETFNILPSNFSLDFKKESNLFRALQIINNSNNESLVYFNDKFMPMVMDYCGLQRGENNEDGCKVDKTNGDRYGFQHDKTRYEFTFDEKIKSNEDKEYENVRLIRKFADNFNTDPNRLKGKGNYDENYQPGFADFVKNEKIISGDKLNYKNMVTFIADLETSKRNYIDYKDHETAENVFTNRPPENSSDSLYA